MKKNIFAVMIFGVIFSFSAFAEITMDPVTGKPVPTGKTDSKYCSIDDQKQGFCGSCDEVAHDAGMCEYDYLTSTETVCDEVSRKDIGIRAFRLIGQSGDEYKLYVGKTYINKSEFLIQMRSKPEMK